MYMKRLKSKNTKLAKLKKAQSKRFQSFLLLTERAIENIKPAKNRKVIRSNSQSIYASPERFCIILSLSLIVMHLYDIKLYKICQNFKTLKFLSLGVAF